MHKKKSNLTPYSKDAKRMRLTQESEDTQERQATIRATELSDQRESRLNKQRIRMRALRAKESKEQREQRLSADRKRHALSRMSETVTERTSRLDSQRIRTANNRSQQAQEEREARLAADRKYHESARKSETSTQRETRLSLQRARTANARSQETNSEREVRLMTDRERHALARESETSTSKEIRLSSQRARTMKSRDLESSSKREARLKADRERHKRARALESEDDRQQRLESARKNYQRRCNGKKKYLLAERERIDAIRQEETDEQRHFRLEADRIRHSFYRQANLSEDFEEFHENRAPSVTKEKFGYMYSSEINYAELAYIGGMVECCPFCKALKWKKEPNGICCAGGKVLIENVQDPPDLIKELLCDQHPLSKHFLDNIHAFNSAFQMTSFGAKLITGGQYMPTFKVQGQVCHFIGSLLPQDEPKFLQIYFVSDHNEQVNIRNQNFSHLNIDLISQLQHMLHQVNPYVRSFKAALESIPQTQNDEYKVIITDDRRPVAENRGTHNEVAVVLVDQECDRRDIVVRTHHNHLQRIYETHRAYDALQYPLINCRAEDGYNFGLYQFDPITRLTNYNKKISALQFYAYQLQIRRKTAVYLQRFRALFNQFLVDMYAKIETERLVYIRTNQVRLRAENYVHLRDAMQQDKNVENMGQLVILPSSFTGGPRYLNERKQDAFCYVRKYGRPDLFITFTANPKWNEITQELLTGQTSFDRHDITARVFHLKLKLLINLITKEKLFGTCVCYMYSVEWQKLGLPHAHILLWLEEKIRPDAVDTVISAEFPDPSKDPTLYDIVKTHMVHGPCGALNKDLPCMKNGRCSQKYPKALTDQTIFGINGYALYRRKSPQHGGFTASVQSHGQNIILDNRWVVPFSPVLSKTFEAHINVELCNSVEAIKYICKYLNKGNEQATVALRNNNDEITMFQSGRYISSSEAVWRIFGFSIHERYPPVIHLAVHLEGGQRVYFKPDNVIDRIENPRKTTLLAFFELCQTDAFAKTLLYNEVPLYYTYDKQQGVFNPRKQGTVVDEKPGIFKENIIGRVYTVHPNHYECFYLRLLLHTVRGPTSFADLRKVGDIEYTTYQAACRARHLLDSDQYWDDALSEACISDTPNRLRHLFAIMLVFCTLSDAEQLWKKYQDKLSEDFCTHTQLNNGNTRDITESNLNRCLLAIQDIVTSIGGDLISQYGMPKPIFEGERFNNDYAAETNYDPVELAEALHTGVSMLTEEQHLIFKRVCHSVDDALGEILFLDAPGGTGKTFLTKVILAKVRSQGKIALAVASSGIAATLLPGGKTAHSMFKIPINLDLTDTPVCNISRDSEKASVLRDCSLIIWDECTMANRKVVEAVDRTLRDIRRNNQPMGGITILFCGDFRQTLPVIPRGTRADEIRACLKGSTLWRNIIPLHLTINMRAQSRGNVNVQEFSNLLLEIGNGTYPQSEGRVILQKKLCCTVSSVSDLMSSVYGNAAQITNHENSWLCERAILTPRNDQATEINTEIMKFVPGECIEYISINQVMEQEDCTSYPVEFLESLSTSGLPAHRLNLKIGVPIMLLRNLHPPKLCNGTRLKVTGLQRNLIEAEILTGCGAGDSVFIPRIPFIPNDFSFSFKRIQFPVNICYAMTINKAQGQTLKVAGVDLSVCCFSHGQLYVALSRVSNASDVFILNPKGYTANIVYREALA